MYHLSIDRGDEIFIIWKLTSAYSVLHGQQHTVVHGLIKNTYNYTCEIYSRAERKPYKKALNKTM